MLTARLTYGRGYNSDTNPGTNTNYYLCTGEWYRTLSPDRFERVSLMDSVFGEGYVSGYGSLDSSRGVRPVVSLHAGTVLASMMELQLNHIR